MQPAGAFALNRVEARELACTRGGRAVFSGVSFGLERGQALAVTGPNGAGKSSLLRLLAGLLRPDSGRIHFEGRAEDEPVTHYFGHADAQKPALTLREALRFWSSLYQQQGQVALDADFNEAADAVGLRNALDLHVGVLSAGQRRRAGLARLVLTPRPLWLLDEPAASLDSEGETLLARLMREHLGRGGLIIAATHQDLPVAPAAVLNLGAA
jgi:heme exporter protein A